MLQTIIDGYFTESECKAIKAKMQGKTFFNFDISYSNQAGNCELIVSSDIANYDDDEYTAKDLHDMFIYACIGELARGGN